MKEIVKAIRCMFRDNNGFLYRMGAGFAGDVSRTHPFAVEAVLQNVAAPVTQYGSPVIYTATNDARPFTTGDQALTYASGFLARPYPIQQQSGGMSASIGAATPPATGVIDILRSGMIMAQLNIVSGAPAAAKGGAVFVWVGAAGSGHVIGGLETQAGGGSNTAALDVTKFQFNGPADANGIVELSVSAGF